MTSQSPVADRLAVVALLLAVMAAAAGLLIPGLYRDTAEMVRQARATDLITLAAATPALGLGLWRARPGSYRGRLVAIGALGYLAYSYAIFGFSVVVNPMTPVHIAILGLASWSLLLAVSGLTGGARPIRMPRRTTGVFLIVVSGLFALLWLSQIAGAITSGELPTAVTALNLPTSAIYALDLAFALPILTVAGLSLVRNDRRGAASALAGLCWLALTGLSVLVIFGMDAAAGVPVALIPVAIFAVITGIATVLAGISLTSRRPAAEA